MVTFTFAIYPTMRLGECIFTCSVWQWYCVQPCHSGYYWWGPAHKVHAGWSLFTVEIIIYNTFIAPTLMYITYSAVYRCYDEDIVLRVCSSLCPRASNGWTHWGGWRMTSKTCHVAVWAVLKLIMFRFTCVAFIYKPLCKYEHSQTTDYDVNLWLIMSKTPSNKGYFNIVA